jgi:hypothetical protein
MQKCSYKNKQMRINIVTYVFICFFNPSSMDYTLGTTDVNDTLGIMVCSTPYAQLHAAFLWPLVMTKTQILYISLTFNRGSAKQRK